MHPGPLFTIFGKGVTPYGLFIAVGIILCLLVYFTFTKKKGMPSKVQDFTFYVIIAAIGLGFLGAKIGQTIYVWLSSGVFDFKNSGISAMAGFIAGAVIFVAVYFGIGKFVLKVKKKVYI
ncbi:MAG: prolipoprotein diacylglyceryl transferase [Clostridia bacterium]|nr:prolipoprotein diacylglyceryl transferase [Clostridia bacterium]